MSPSARGSRRSVGLVRFAQIALASVLLAGAGACGIVLVDISQRDLVLEPVDRIDVVSGGGAVEIYALDRNGISLFYYMFGSLREIGDVGHRFADDGRTLEVLSVCERTDFCTIDWYAEIPHGTAVDVVTHGGPVKLTGVDADIVADVAGGGFDGVGLGPDALDVVIEAGDAVIELLEPPSAAIVSVGEGSVELTLPPGDYRCELATGDGEIDTTDVVCDPMATALVQIEVDIGDITLLQGPPP